MQRFLVAFVCLVLTVSASAQSLLDAAKLAPIAPIVEAEIEAGRIPGAVVLIGQGERILYAQAFGQRSLAPAAEPMTIDTVFDLASLTKPVATAAAILQLAERRTLDLDAPVARYWKRFAVHGKEHITLRQLLSHTSGLPSGIDLRRIKGAEEVRLRLADVKPESRPAAVPVYSDVNYAVLGEVVHKVSGERLDRYAVRHVFAPLRMHDTGFLPAAEKGGRIAPTVLGDDERRRGVVHDPLAARLEGVAGNAGLFGTAEDLARFARALLAGGSPILKSATVTQMFSPQTYPAATPRGLGWKLDAPLAANRAALPSLGAVSHLGYTGTGLWLDPVTDTYVVILSNRVHVKGGDAGPLRAKVVAAVAESLGPLPPERIAERRPELADRVGSYVPKTVATPVRSGLDVLVGDNFAPLRGLRFGLLTNRSGVDASGRRNIEVLAASAEFSLKALFSPEHGLGANREGRISNETDLRTGLPIFSLYGATRRPTPQMLDGLDALVIDLQDAGVRFYTYISTVAYVMEAAAERGLQVFVLDRPNPLNGSAVQGPLLDPERRSFTGIWMLPVRHGLTLGEFARYYREEAGVAVKLTVIPMRGYRRELWYDDSGLPWLPPSPNLTSFTSAILYPGVGMIEGAEISVGRGTAMPFEVVGAPWIDGRQLAAALTQLGLAGVRFSATEFEPVADRYVNVRCQGVRIEVTDREALDSPALGVALAATLQRLYPRHFTLEKLLGSVGSQATLDAIRAGQSPAAIVAGWQESLERFKLARARHLLYP